jgi:hypothetical protein
MDECAIIEVSFHIPQEVFMKGIRKYVIFSVMALAVLGFSACDFFNFEPTATVTGSVYDAVSHSYLSGVDVSVEGHPSLTAVTDSTGEFSIEVPEGDQVLNFSYNGRFFESWLVTIDDVTLDYILNSDVVAYASIPTGQFRAVLTWGSTPYDLDSHLVLPNGSHEDVYFSHKTANDASANLDIDDTSAYGPETVTISTILPGTYYYSIYNYSGSGSPSANTTLGTSGATVRIYDGNTLLATYRASAITGASSSTDRWWRVFSFTNGVVTPINSFASTAY